MLSLIGRWFYQPSVSQDCRQADYMVLGVILAAGVFLRPGGLCLGTTSLGDGEGLLAMLEQYDKGQIYIIGSGENFVGARRSLLSGAGVYEVLESDRGEVLYVGRNGKTKVWR